MKYRVMAWALALMSLTLAGCATRTDMALQNDNEKLTEQSKPIYLMTATIKNAYKPSHQPKLLVVNVEKTGAKDSGDRLNFMADDKANTPELVSDAGSGYVMRMQLDAGSYELLGLTSLARSFPIQAFFFTPVHAKLNVKDPGVFYLGHVSATVRERQGDEFKAGPSIPLIDQSVAGASGGTFDIEISDRFESDEKLLRTKFPALASVKIQKAVLPPFDRVKAQKWWEAN